MVELPLLAKMYEKFKPEGFELIAVTLKRTTPSMIRNIANKNQMAYTFLRDETGPGKVYVPDVYKMGLMGYVALIDEEGRVKHFFDNWSQDIDPVARYERLLGEMLKDN